MIGSISLTQAQSMISASVNWAKDNNQHIAVAVVDCVGELIAFSRMDETSPQTCLLAQNKAYTAARDRQKTSQLAAWSKETGKTINFWTDARITGMAGGVPIKDGNGKVLGAMGISGMAEEADEALAEQVASQFFS
ncbi:heme-binding protein [Alteromonas gracilis]|uniref:GlcG/HbpS family heme-binding protein n=1 Tax=Alteromonas gracilis TaxID=1479524 RepID=UPI0037355D44